MPRTIEIDPVTRIEGHARISLTCGDDGQVTDAKFHVTQLRGFEKFCEGRPFPEMPSLTARTCGICPVSHLMASSKACDKLMAVEIPPTADMLRRIMNLVQLTQSHALSFFHLSSPDMLLGWDADPLKRNIFGVAVEHPELARDGIMLRKFGQEIIKMLGGKKIHPAWMVPGGVNEPLTEDERAEMLKMLPNTKSICQRTLDWFKKQLVNFKEEADVFGNFPSMYMGLVTPDGGLEHYDGVLRVMNEQGEIIADGVDTDDYEQLVGEAVEPFSYMKFPYYKPTGYPDGMYRVGPLARCNIADHAGTPQADKELAEFKQMQKDPIQASFHYHYARLVEITFALEAMEQLLNDPDILNTHVRARARGNRPVGVGIAEAPRGTLIHHYEIDEHCLMKKVNLIIATGHNNLAMNKGILQAAKHYVDGNKVQEGALNRVEAVIRCYDPCLSCATHALGQMPIRIELLSPDGDVIDEVRRD